MKHIQSFENFGSEEQVNEILGLSKKEKFAKIDKTDDKQVRNFFTGIFGSVINKMSAIKQAVTKTPKESLVKIIDSALAEKTIGGLIVDKSGQVVYKPAGQQNISSGFGKGRSRLG